MLKKNRKIFHKNGKKKMEEDKRMVKKSKKGHEKDREKRKKN